MIGDLRPAIGGYVAEVIADWQPHGLIARFEAELGPDLQYIRINGAVLGALIGGAIFERRPARLAFARASALRECRCRPSIQVLPCLPWLSASSRRWVPVPISGARPSVVSAFDSRAWNLGAPAAAARASWSGFITA